MARRRDPELVDDLFRLFLVAPIWVGPVVAAVMFGVLWSLPLVIPDTGPMKLLVPISHMLAWVVGGMIMVAWIVAGLVRLMGGGNGRGRRG